MIIKLNPFQTLGKTVIGDDGAINITVINLTDNPKYSRVDILK